MQLECQDMVWENQASQLGVHRLYVQNKTHHRIRHGGPEVLCKRPSEPAGPGSPSCRRDATATGPPMTTQSMIIPILQIMEHDENGW